jgi:hypothetical protein
MNRTNFKLEGNNTISYDAIQDLKKLTHGDQEYPAAGSLLCCGSLPVSFPELICYNVEPANGIKSFSTSG